MSARALLALVEEIEGLVGAREQRVFHCIDDEPEPPEAMEHDIIIRTVTEDPDAPPRRPTFIGSTSGLSIRWRLPRP
jgi:hypothetical protein